MKKMLFIMNPFSGQKRANKFLPDILLLYSQAGFDVTVHMTTAQGSAREAVLRLGQGMDLVVCCGGDGTFNETVHGMLELGLTVPIGYIPAGSTNDFAASLRLSTNILQAARDILDGEPVSYDVGKFGGRYFSYVASFGAFTRASYATPQSIKNALGHTAYLLEGINELSQIRKVHIRMEMDEGVVEDDFLFGAISNSTSVGGILTLNSNQVDLGDGLFEILLVREEKKKKLRSKEKEKAHKEKTPCRLASYSWLHEKGQKPFPFCRWYTTVWFLSRLTILNITIERLGISSGSIVTSRAITSSTLLKPTSVSSATFCPL